MVGGRCLIKNLISGGVLINSRGLLKITIYKNTNAFVYGYKTSCYKCMAKYASYFIYRGIPPSVRFSENTVNLQENTYVKLWYKCQFFVYILDWHLRVSNNKRTHKHLHNIARTLCSTHENNAVRT